MSTTHRFPQPQNDPQVPVQRKPEWLKVRLPHGEGYERVKAILEKTRLATVCQEARCPNMGECWGGGTATVMLMGETCTRACRFCHVKMGAPAPLDPNEPENLALAVKELGLKYLVVTSVDRDDVPDGGAGHFAQAITALKRESPKTMVEVLIPDFQGSEACLDVVAQARPDVIAHNVETVRRLQRVVRDKRAGWKQSVRVLEYLKQKHGVYTKSSIMLGVGETPEDLREAFKALRDIGVDVLTLGQYLQPSTWHLKVERYYSPAEFDALRDEAMTYGFLYVAAGPLVRSSYRAAEFFLRGLMRQKPDAAAPAP
ncbi:MAG: lipoyl synthase [Myxococcales bacterium]